MPTYNSLSIKNKEEFIFGKCVHPVKLKSGLTIGEGKVYPELNFTLPSMIVREDTMDEVRQQYNEMVRAACARAGELAAEGLVIEFELLPELTINPEWGKQVVEILRSELEDAQKKYGIKVGLRATPNDIREFERPPYLRKGVYLEAMLKSFSLCAQAGADMLAIESTGGKEIHDDAILQGDLPLSVFALGVLGARDMRFLWEKIVAIANDHSVVPSGDSACGFANTAMVLAENHYIPRVWAALIRVMAVPRSLVAFEQGARGPNKDCAYEGVYLKAITGCPISLEGAEAACAHLSAIGNITKAVPDLWSNESVQNVKLLGSMAPTVSMEQLIYATRLMNVASSKGMAAAKTLQDWWVESDAARDVQAYVLRPDVAWDIAAEIVDEPTAYLRTRRAALKTLQQIRHARNNGEIFLSKLELRWLDKLQKQAEELPEEEDKFIASIRSRIPTEKIHMDEYLL